MSHLVVKDNGCWEWNGKTNKSGYGSIRFNGEIPYVHRLSYRLFINKIPKGLYVCHSCDNPPCCNPNHLWIGTHEDNMNDKISKNRQSRLYGDKNGSTRHPESKPRGNEHWTRKWPNKIARGKDSWLHKHAEVTRGERNGKAKLTKDLVKKIRKMYATDKYTQKELSKKFKMSIGHISVIIRRRCWDYPDC